VAILRRGLEADFLFESKGYSGDLRVVQVAGREAISRLFSFHLDLAGEDWEVDLDAVVGQPAALTIKGLEGERTVHGIVSRMEQGGKGEKFAPYKVELVPEAWLLTRFFRSRIFQKKTVKDIVQEVLKGAGISSSHFRFALKRSPPVREYCVQYRETDWNFVSRLLEEEGIFFFFEQKDKETVLVMGDSPDAVVAIPSPEKIPYREPSATAAEKEAVYDFRFAQELKSGKAALKDYNFTRPDVYVEGEAKAKRDDKLEIYDYPGYYGVSESGGASDAEKFKSGDLNALGKDLAQIRLEEEQATRRRAEGNSLCRRFLPGFSFKLAGHPRDDFSLEYLLVSVEHSGSQPAVPAAGAPKMTYDNRFACIPKDVVFRPARLTPKPTVRGVQTALVTGPKGEEIYTDSFGRVKVQFPWDREGKKDDKSSSWVRVSSAWAGKGWGSIYIPRIGQEVVVDFIEGDPDRPIITGRVYNGNNQPPYKLPDEKTKSTLKSDSSKGGDGFNEIRFEDNKGKEQIFIHAEKDMDVRIKNDRREWVGRNRHLVVKQDKFEHVENKRHEAVDSDHLEKIKGDRNLAVGGKEAIEVGGSHSFTVKGDVIEVFKANHSEQTTGDCYLKAMNLVLEAMASLTLKCGGGSVVVGPAGVTLSGGMITVDGGMVKIASGPGDPAGSGSAGSAVSPGAPDKAQEADVAEPGETEKIKAEQREKGAGKYGSEPAKPYKKDEEKQSWVEIELVDEDSQPVPGEKYQIQLPDGSVAEGTLDHKGYARVEGIDPGSCKVTFPNLDKEAWEKGGGKGGGKSGGGGDGKGSGKSGGGGYAKGGEGESGGKGSSGGYEKSGGGGGEGGGGSGYGKESESGGKSAEGGYGKESGKVSGSGYSKGSDAGGKSYEKG